MWNTETAERVRLCKFVAPRAMDRRNVAVLADAVLRQPLVHVGRPRALAVRPHQLVERVARGTTAPQVQRRRRPARAKETDFAPTAGECVPRHGRLPPQHLVDPRAHRPRHPLVHLRERVQHHTEVHLVQYQHIGVARGVALHIVNGAHVVQKPNVAEVVPWQQRLVLNLSLVDVTPQLAVEHADHLNAHITVAAEPRPWHHRPLHHRIHNLMHELVAVDDVAEHVHAVQEVHGGLHADTHSELRGQVRQWVVVRRRRADGREHVRVVTEYLYLDVARDFRVPEEPTELVHALREDGGAVADVEHRCDCGHNDGVGHDADEDGHE
eukprot:PhM_4_TR6334/c0_g1_i1/m.25901